MPQIETWSRLPAAVRDHLVDRMRDRNISLPDLNLLRILDGIEARCTRRPLVQGLWIIQVVSRRQVSQDFSLGWPGSYREKVLAGNEF